MSTCLLHCMIIWPCLSPGKKQPRAAAHSLHQVRLHHRQDWAGGPRQGQPGQWRGRVLHQVRIFDEKKICPPTDDVSCVSFTGIPYATPPVSNRRFAEAEPVLGWPGELDATRSKAACPRYVTWCHNYCHKVRCHQDRGQLHTHDDWGLSVSKHLHQEPGQEELWEELRLRGW